MSGSAENANINCFPKEPWSGGVESANRASLRCCIVKRSTNNKDTHDSAGYAKGLKRKQERGKTQIRREKNAIRTVTVKRKRTTIFEEENVVAVLCRVASRGRRALTPFKE